MQDNTEYLEADFIIWNGTLGVRDFVTLGEIDPKNNTACLDEPYEMVGPFCLDELISCGQISFAACIVMTQQRWQEGKKLFQQEAFTKQCKIQRELNEEIKLHNKKRQYFMQTRSLVSEKEYRELLSLPLEGILEITQIKTAYKKVAKKAHPDVGGSHEMFVKLTQARDALLGE